MNDLKEVTFLDSDYLRGLVYDLLALQKEFKKDAELCKLLGVEVWSLKQDLLDMKKSRLLFLQRARAQDREQFVKTCRRIDYFKNRRKCLATVARYRERMKNVRDFMRGFDAV